MKITKQRLKEIIREELTSLNESDLPSWEGPPFGPYDLDAENEKARRAAEEPIGAEIEDAPEVSEDEPSSPSAEALTILRPLHAMSERFSNYLESNGIPADYEAIKQHLIELGLESNEAGIYALYGMK